MADAASGQSLSYAYRPDPTRESIFTNDSVPLADFFARPVQIASYTWTPGTPYAGATLRPWAGYFGNKRIINRINNYELLRANLHVRIMINGNGFYYGRLLVDYAPLSSQDTNTDFATNQELNLMQASQRMHVMIDPCDCCSTEMTLPFFYYYDAVRVSNGDWADLGTMYFRELTPLKHANASTQPINITVLAWASDVYLAVPTATNSVSLVPQAGEKDEYSANGPISSIATAAASVADRAGGMPAIGRYAKATSLALGGVSRIAAAFGFSRPPNLAPNNPMRPTFMSDLATYNGTDNVQKTTIDAKQELTVDPNVTGVDLPDEMSLATIAAKETYLTSFAWATTKVPGNTLWNSYVTPFLARAVTTPTVKYYLPACLVASLPAAYWRGKMSFRFQVVASGYHRGRLRVVWDPNATAVLPEFAVQFTKIVDITEERDFTIDVDWGQNAHYLPNTGAVSAATGKFGAANLTARNDAANGTLSIYVLNELATPNSTANNNITVNVFVSLKDAEYAEASGPPLNLVPMYSATAQPYPVLAQDVPSEDQEIQGSTLVPHAGEDAETDAMPECDTAPPEVMGGTDIVPEDALVFFGDRVLSIRQILKRYTMHSTFYLATTVTTNPTVFLLAQTDVPAPYGYTNDGGGSGRAQAGASTAPCNYAFPSWLTFFMPAYAGMRGSMRSKYHVTSTDKLDMGLFTIERGLKKVGNDQISTVNVGVASQSGYQQAMRLNTGPLGRGAVATPASVQPVLEVEFPYYETVRFDDPRNFTIPSIYYGGVLADHPNNPFTSCHQLVVRAGVGATAINVDRLVSVGEDFSLLWWQGMPPLVNLTVPTPP